MSSAADVHTPTVFIQFSTWAPSVTSNYVFVKTSNQRKDLILIEKMYVVDRGLSYLHKMHSGTPICPYMWITPRQLQWTPKKAIISHHRRAFDEQIALDDDEKAPTNTNLWSSVSCVMSTWRWCWYSQPNIPELEHKGMTCIDNMKVETLQHLNLCSLKMVDWWHQSIQE